MNNKRNFGGGVLLNIQERRTGTLTCSPRLPKGGQRRKGEVISRG